ncbi:MAG: ATP-binding cassette domain-containing protein [Planctomycetota bacterium]
MSSKSLNEPPDYVLELAGLEQRLFDPERGEQFVVRVKHHLQIARRSVVALLGPSGCGKTTLLTVLGLLRSPTQPDSLETFIMRTQNQDGTWLEHDLRQIWMRRQLRQVERLRRQHLGFALQSGELLPALTVRENIAAPLRLNGMLGQRCWDRVDELLTTFRLDGSGVSDTAGTEAERQQRRRRLAFSRINKLSGGEYQRVALARAIAHRPTLLYVDEPTSALNRELAWGALEQLRLLQCSESSQGAAVMITHDEQLAAAFADVIIRMAPVKGQPVGEVVEVTRNSPIIATSISSPEAEQSYSIVIPADLPAPSDTDLQPLPQFSEAVALAAAGPLTQKVDA